MAHKSSQWYVVIAVAFSKPGRYYLKRIRIDYTTDGHQGWQYQDIDTTVVISDPPDPGPKPLPSSAVCGLLPTVGSPPSAAIGLAGEGTVNPCRPPECRS